MKRKHVAIVTAILIAVAIGIVIISTSSKEDDVIAQSVFPFYKIGPFIFKRVTDKALLLVAKEDDMTHPDFIFPEIFSILFVDDYQALSQRWIMLDNSGNTFLVSKESQNFAYPNIGTIGSSWSLMNDPLSRQRTVAVTGLELSDASLSSRLPDGYLDASDNWFLTEAIEFDQIHLTKVTDDLYVDLGYFDQTRSTSNVTFLVYDGRWRMYDSNNLLRFTSYSSDKVILPRSNWIDHGESDSIREISSLLTRKLKQFDLQSLSLRLENFNEVIKIGNSYFTKASESLYLLSYREQGTGTLQKGTSGLRDDLGDLGDLRDIRYLRYIQESTGIDFSQHWVLFDENHSKFRSNDLAVVDKPLSYVLRDPWLSMDETEQPSFDTRVLFLEGFGVNIFPVGDLRFATKDLISETAVSTDGNHVAVFLNLTVFVFDRESDSGWTQRPGKIANIDTPEPRLLRMKIDNDGNSILLHYPRFKIESGVATPRLQEVIGIYSYASSEWVAQKEEVIEPVDILVHVGPQGPDPSEEGVLFGDTRIVHWLDPDAGKLYRKVGDGGSFSEMSPQEDMIVVKKDTRDEIYTFSTGRKKGWLRETNISPRVLRSNVIASNDFSKYLIVTYDAVSDRYNIRIGKGDHPELYEIRSNPHIQTLTDQVRMDGHGKTVAILYRDGNVQPSEQAYNRCSVFRHSASSDGSEGYDQLINLESDEGFYMCDPIAMSLDGETLVVPFHESHISATGQMNLRVFHFDGIESEATTRDIQLDDPGNVGLRQVMIDRDGHQLVIISRDDTVVVFNYDVSDGQWRKKHSISSSILSTYETDSDESITNASFTWTDSHPDRMIIRKSEYGGLQFFHIRDPTDETGSPTGSSVRSHLELSNRVWVQPDESKKQYNLFTMSQTTLYRSVRIPTGIDTGKAVELASSDHSVSVSYIENNDILRVIQESRTDPGNWLSTYRRENVLDRSMANGTLVLIDKNSRSIFTLTEEESTLGFVEWGSTLASSQGSFVLCDLSSDGNVLSTVSIDNGSGQFAYSLFRRKTTGDGWDHSYHYPIDQNTSDGYSIQSLQTEIVKEDSGAIVTFALLSLIASDKDDLCVALVISTVAGSTDLELRVLSQITGSSPSISVDSDSFLVLTELSPFQSKLSNLKLLRLDDGTVSDQSVIEDYATIESRVISQTISDSTSSWSREEMLQWSIDRSSTLKKTKIRCLASTGEIYSFENGLDANDQLIWIRDKVKVMEEPGLSGAIVSFTGNHVDHGTGSNERELFATVGSSGDLVVFRSKSGPRLCSSYASELADDDHDYSDHGSTQALYRLKDENDRYRWVTFDKERKSSTYSSLGQDEYENLAHAKVIDLQTSRGEKVSSVVTHGISIDVGNSTFTKFKDVSSTRNQVLLDEFTVTEHVRLSDSKINGADGAELILWKDPTSFLGSVYLEFESDSNRITPRSDDGHFQTLYRNMNSDSGDPCYKKWVFYDATGEILLSKPSSLGNPDDITESGRDGWLTSETKEMIQSNALSPSEISLPALECWFQLQPYSSMVYEPTNNRNLERSLPLIDNDQIVQLYKVKDEDVWISLTDMHSIRYKNDRWLVFDANGMSIFYSQMQANANSPVNPFTANKFAGSDSSEYGQYIVGGRTLHWVNNDVKNTFLNLNSRNDKMERVIKMDHAAKNVVMYRVPTTDNSFEEYASTDGKDLVKLMVDTGPEFDNKLIYNVDDAITSYSGYMSDNVKLLSVYKSTSDYDSKTAMGQFDYMFPDNPLYDNPLEFKEGYKLVSSSFILPASSQYYQSDGRIFDVINLSENNIFSIFMLPASQTNLTECSFSADGRWMRCNINNEINYFMAFPDRPGYFVNLFKFNPQYSVGVVQNYAYYISDIKSEIPGPNLSIVSSSSPLLSDLQNTVSIYYCRLIPTISQTDIDLYGDLGIPSPDLTILTEPFISWSYIGTVANSDTSPHTPWYYKGQVTENGVTGRLYHPLAHHNSSTSDFKMTVMPISPDTDIFTNWAIISKIYERDPGVFPIQYDVLVWIMKIDDIGTDVWNVESQCKIYYQNNLKQVHDMNIQRRITFDDNYSSWTSSLPDFRISQNIWNIYQTISSDPPTYLYGKAYYSTIMPLEDFNRDIFNLTSHGVPLYTDFTIGIPVKFHGEYVRSSYEITFFSSSGSHNIDDSSGFPHVDDYIYAVI